MDSSHRLAAVTGASGHLGANLVRALLASGRRVRALVHRRSDGIDGLAVEVVRADVLDRESLIRSFADVATVYHLATRISAGWDDAKLVNDVARKGTANVVEACLGAKVGRMVHVSSIAALRFRPGETEIDEDVGLVEAGDRGRGVYDHAKAESERIVLRAVEAGLSAVVLNPTAILGPNDFGPSPLGEVLRTLALGRLPVLVADASCDFVDARDVAEAALAAEHKGRAGERYVLSGTYLSLVDLAHRWAQVTGASAPGLVVPMWLARAGAPLASAWARLRGRRPLCNSDSLRVLRQFPSTRRTKAERELCFRPRPLDETLGDICAWMKTRGWLWAPRPASTGPSGQVGLFSHLPSCRTCWCDPRPMAATLVLGGAGHFRRAGLGSLWRPLRHSA